MNQGWKNFDQTVKQSSSDIRTTVLFIVHFVLKIVSESILLYFLAVIPYCCYQFSALTVSTFNTNSKSKTLFFLIMQYQFQIYLHLSTALRAQFYAKGILPVVKYFSLPEHCRGVHHKSWLSLESTKKQLVLSNLKSLLWATPTDYTLKKCHEEMFWSYSSTQNLIISMSIT